MIPIETRSRAGLFARLGGMIKFSHTIFALPFALTGMVLAARGLPKLSVIFWVLVAMVGARTAAMSWNRIADREIDAKNPRTATRHLVTGEVSRKEAWAMTIGGVALTVFAAWMLNPLCLALSPVALAAFALYPYAKRFTTLCHIILGICLAGAPVGAWIAVRGSVSVEILPLAFAVVVWVAGFDVLYALQDLNFDREEGLSSLPVKLGVGGSLRLAVKLHVVLVALLIIQAFVSGLGLLYLIGIFCVGGLLLYEHSLVTPYDLSRLDAAFFTMNGVISVVVFAATFLDVIL